ncbi:MAG: tRNA pseudouridine(55) synthase TruB [Candidatus Saccharimonadales bacterium]
MEKGKILLIDKPAGWTSFDVVAKIRGKVRKSYTDIGEKPTKRQLRVGHAGTLDPFATGLLIVLLGDATKRSDEFLKLDKVYEATIRLDATSSTGDPEGEITANQEKSIKKEEIENVLHRFVGEITQTPPIYSAIKIDGQRAYKLARAGRSVNMPSRPVTIYSLDMIAYNFPDLKVRTHVSSGTYIRTLAEDIGRALGTGAYCHELRRLRIGDYDIADADSISEAIINI